MTETRSGGHEAYGPFLVHERLGVGGMAEVHRATRRLADGSEVEVGLKRLHEHLRGNPRAVEEFVEEARIASRMQHDNICRFYEVGRLGDSYFIAMEYIEGRDLGSLVLEARVTKQPLPVSVVLSLLCQLCEALDYAHNRADEDSGAPLEFVHRDVSPTNLLVTREGRLKVIDLGIAKARTREIQTDTGVIKGKFGYMAPEVLAGVRADRRADIFSIGVVAWELLTAERLFAGTSDLETMERIRTGAIEPPSARRRGCPRRLDAVIMRALARRPGDRWRTAAAMRTALRALAAAMHESISPQTVADWLAASEPVPIPITGENSDAITQVRHRTPRTMPRRPARFPRGTVRQPKVEPEEEPSTVVVDEERPLGSVAGERRPAGSGQGERRYRALAMLGGGLLTTAVIAALFVARSPDDEAARLRVAFRSSEVTARALGADGHRPQVSSLSPAPRQAPASLPTQPERARPAVRPATPDSGAKLPKAPPRAERREGPVDVDASEVERLAGKLPRSRASRAEYRARICIDERGKVSSLEVSGGPERLHRRIARHLRRWRYRPFRQDGAPVPVCFEVVQHLLPWK